MTPQVRSRQELNGLSSHNLRPLGHCGERRARRRGPASAAAEVASGGGQSNLQKADILNLAHHGGPA